MLLSLRRIAFHAAAALFVASFAPGKAVAQRVSFIQDAEIESALRAFVTPVFEAAHLDPQAVKIYLVNDKTLNAFVAGGQKVFVNTGLLMRSDDATQVIGVIAHETGHIAHGDLSKIHQAISNSSAQGIVAFVLGAAAAIGTGRPDVGQAIIAGGAQLGTRSFLQYSRDQEAAADQAAVRFLDAAGMSARGLTEFLAILGDQELLSSKRQDPYVRTHPVSRERIDLLASQVARSPHANTPLPSEFVMMHSRMVAKLRGFLDPPQQTLRTYDEADRSVAARYARAVAYYRQPDLAKALPLIDGLIAEHPSDPYFYELKGQVLFENGRAKEAYEPYETASRLAPGEPLIRLGLARVQLALDDPALLDAAIANLRAAVQANPEDAFLWRQLAIAYGRNGDIGMSSLAMAEEGLLTGDHSAATFHATRASEQLTRGSAGWLKAQDVLAAAEHAKKAKEGE